MEYCVNVLRSSKLFLILAVVEAVLRSLSPQRMFLVLLLPDIGA